MKQKLTLLVLGLFFSSIIFAQNKKKNASQSINQNSTSNTPIGIINDSLYNALKWRNIGPFRAGRSLACAGHESQPLTYYFGATGGGVWKTIDGGGNWVSISDSTFHSSSVGAIMVAPSDPNILYVGMGEADMRSNISFGDGIYKSTDAGKTWKFCGLPKADAIATIDVHPKDANLVYVAAIGNPFSPNKERGVFRSKDGGKNWEQILSKNDSTGAYHVRLDPTNPNIVYATLWQAYRNGYNMESGGKGSGLYKSTDGGDTWECLNEKPGMPKGLLGKIGIAVSPVNGNRLYALIENAKGGLFRSDDGGQHWELLNEDKNLWQRPWYYMNLQADPLNVNGLIVLNVDSWKTFDGGKSFQRIAVHHGDTHDVWINPKNSSNFIISDDGGAEVTFNGGATFSDIDIPTCQFYHVSLDNDFPYNVYGAQQDNSAVRIASRTDGFSIGMRDWYPVAGGESGYIAADPKNSKITFGGSYDGFMSMQDETNNQNKLITVYPESAIGSPSAAKKFRFQWTYPLLFSPFDNTRLYATSQFVHVSQDYGHSWEIISPDLTRNDPKTTGPTGGPITKDMTGAEIYATIFTFAESPIEKGNYWAGSDDGYLHVSKDAGKNWTNITLPTSQLPDFALMSIIHPSDFTKGKAYLAATRYMSGDRKPYMFKTTDYGKTWTSIVNGIPTDEYCHVVREDPNKQGLLYAGTERGVYVSFDDGDSWRKLNLNLPSTPIRDLVIHKREKDLVVSTHGRGFWILDDVTPLHEIKDIQLTEKGTKMAYRLFKPRSAYRMQGGQISRRRGEASSEGVNAPNGVLVHYYLKNIASKELKLQFLTATNDSIITYSSKKDKKGEAIKISKDFYEDTKAERQGVLANNAGMNRFVWDMRYPDATAVEGTNVMWAGSIIGPKIIPGQYKVRFLVGDSLISEQPFEILKDPRLKITDDDYKEQLAFLRTVNKKLDQTHKGINQIRQIRKAVNDYMGAIKDSTITRKFAEITKPMLKNLDDLESQLMQPKAKAPQDVLAHPVMLNDKLAGVGSHVESSDSKPTKSSYEVLNDLSNRIEGQMGKLKKIIDEDVPKFNNLVKEQNIPAINVKKEDKKIGM